MRTKAKELGVPFEFIQKMLNSSYVFGIHIEKINGSGKVTKVNKTVPLTGIKIPAYEITFDLPINAKVLIYNYDLNKNEFVLYKEIKAWSGIGTGLFDGETMYLIPTHEQAMKAFNNTFQTALKAAAISANYELKKDDNFAIFAPVTGTDGSAVMADIGVSEDVRVDHPFEVMEKVDGEFKTKGYTKARNVFINCGEAGQTEFALTKGNAEQADLMREYPWTGLFFYLGGGLSGRSIAVTGEDKTTLEASGKKTELGGMTAFGGELGVSADLGYATNTSFLSEVWFNLFFKFAAGGESIDGYYDAPFYYGGGIELSKRFYLGGSGIFAAPGASFSYEKGSASYNGTDGYDDLTITTLMVTPALQVGYMFSPSFELILKGGWNQPFGATVKAGDEEKENVEMKGGVYAMINASIHLPIVGPMAKIYSRPSNICQDMAKKKKEENAKNAPAAPAPQPAPAEGTPEPVKQESVEQKPVEQQGVTQ